VLLNRWQLDLWLPELIQFIYQVLKSSVGDYLGILGCLGTIMSDSLSRHRVARMSMAHARTKSRDYHMLYLHNKVATQQATCS